MTTTRRYGQSPLWESNNRIQVTESAVADLRGFKSGTVNFKLALWDPRTNGMRYLKTLIFNLAAGLSEANRARLRRIRNRDVGDPITVRYDGEDVCMDYLEAVLELEFMSGAVPLDGLRVLEIGAGYGRTCHALMSNHDLVSYDIVDLDNALRLSRAYLGAVLDPGRFAKIRFHSVDEVDALPADQRFDLCVNVDSFAEMNAETVRAYLDLVAGRCRYLYVNNPVGKYLDPSLDGHAQGAEVVALALRTGPLLDVIDIHDNRAVEAQSRRFLAAYRPGDDWTCVADARAVPWTFYWQALYEKNTPEKGGREQTDARS
ncbi:putative sugar O-methyltransferase [Microbispora amethystogenes]|uniref:putative sugar O-methyltransferase n=1 Tax=Microbispora amethystogenes TaxID=1427754 RepID=UPI0033D6A386